MRPKTGSFAKRLYLPRTLGSGVGFWAVAAALYPHGASAWLWALLVFQGYLWPHLAYRLARRVPMPYLVERRNMLLESAFGGLWVAAMQFNSLPTILLVSMLCMNCIAVGGPGLLKRCTAVLAVTLLGSIALLQPAFLPGTSHWQVYACLPMLAVYPLAVGGAAYRLAAELAAHKRQFREFSRRDSLTGLLNQGTWWAALKEHYQQQAQGLAVATLALVDIDHFKRINDEHGHLAGDEVIKLLGGVLREHARSQDRVGRIGGDEFGLLLGRTDSRQAQVVLAGLQKQLLQALAARPDLPAVTLSIGMAECSPLLDSAEAWVKACDEVLYAAKGQGRNRIVSRASAA